MIAPSEFKCYLQEICRRYEQWWTVDALTEMIADRQATFSFEQMVQTEEKKPREKPQIVSLPIVKGIQNYVKSEHILLVGSPGVGKSTALLRCLVSFAKEELGKAEPRIPVLVPLKRYNVRFSSSEDPSGMLTLIREALKPQLRLKISEVEELLFEERLILLLDGLNEMPADTVRTQLKAFREECDKIPFICTTRELGSGDLGIKRRLEVQPPSPLEINRFLRECMPAQAEQVLQLLSRDNRELSRTPFVLWMLYHLFQETGAVVETLGEAFRQFFQSFKKYKEDAPVTDERRKAWNPWLEHLAFTMLDSPEPNDPGLVISDEQAEKVLAERFGDLHGASSRIEELLKYHFLERVSEKEVSFHHQLIQEYYAAEYLLQYLPELLRDEEGETQLKCYYLNYRKWTEPLALMLELVEEQTQTVQVVQLALEVDLRLGARLAGAVKSQFQEQTVSLVKGLVIPQYLEIRLLGITRSGYAVTSIKQALKNENFDTRTLAISALGEINNEATTSVLIEILEDKNEDSMIRATAARTLGEIGSSKVTSSLIKALKNTRLVQTIIFTEIKENVSQVPNQTLLEAHSRISTVCRSIIETLGKIGNESAVPILIQVWRDPDSMFCYEAAVTLRKIGGKVAVSNLLQALRKPSQANCIASSSAYAFGTVRDKAAVPDLMQALKDKNNESLFRHDVAIALGEMGSEDAISLLLQIIEDKNEESLVRYGAAYALGELRCKNTIPALLQTMEDKDVQIRSGVAYALGKTGSEEAISILVKTLENQIEDQNVRSAAAYALGKIGSRTVITHLVEALSDQEYSVRMRAVEALGELGGSTEVPLIIKILENQDEYYDIRHTAAYVLGKIGTEAAIRGLLSVLKDRNPHIRRSAIDGLEKAKSEKTTTKLIENSLISCLNDEAFFVRQNAAYALGKIATSEILTNLTDLLREMGETDLLDTISHIQSRCGFYNYEIAQSSPSELPNANGNVQNEFIQGRLNVTNNFNFDQRGASIGVNVANEGSNIKFIQHAKQSINISEQDLAEAAQKIQALLNQLAQTYPPTTETQQQNFIQKFLEQLESTPNLIKVLLAGGIEGLKILCPPAGIPVEMARRLYEVVQERHSQR
ncbi:MAG: HEAT repeat domain-containing protein [Kastovskya adunca ATA6-11-RM4]|jgi:HEAT repeat protein|nr:HEAT repeat domain-containing protein [Kastovskya adunca ATA6-11-RM4]